MFAFGPVQRSQCTNFLRLFVLHDGVLCVFNQEQDYRQDQSICHLKQTNVTGFIYFNNNYLQLLGVVFVTITVSWSPTKY
jgi:hypothetical protein